MDNPRSYTQFERLERIAEYLFREQKALLTDEERNEFEQWLSCNPDLKSDLSELRSELKNDRTQRENLELLHLFTQKAKADRTYDLAMATRQDTESAQPNLKTPATKVRSFVRRFKVAAILIAVSAISLLTYNIITERDSEYFQDYPTYAVDKTAGTNRAYLKLADGRLIQLDSTQQGIRVDDGLWYEDGSPLLDKTTNDLLTLSPGVPRELELNVPHGGQYRLKLEDGTLVVLNAGSTLYYPTAFEASNRSVRLRGEAYFEVNTQKDRPFIVHTGNHQVHVLGTSFNIDAYEPEHLVKTTLLSGKVRIRRDQEVLDLNPGQQSVSQPEVPLYMHNVPGEDIVAWKDGYFMFNNDPLHEVIAQVARWYDMEVEFNNSALKSEKVYGSISRSENLSSVLRMLEKTGVASFKTSANQIRVMSAKSNL